MANYANGKYQLTNPKKYTGNKAPHYRSGWEHTFMRFCDNNPSVIGWASEAITVPYRNPLTGKQTVYVPDFVVVYQDKKGRKIAEVIEIKPKSQTTLTEKTTKRDKLSVAINHAKWEAAAKWCKLKGLRFRVVTEDDIFHKGKKRG
mgnify:CR=1 FL=1|jgi:hypothetical protein|tara:strand:+ start:90 stop:527 length:438 start_codon:yes stop_codon:yes gene_type:complete